MISSPLEVQRAVVDLRYLDSIGHHPLVRVGLAVERDAIVRHNVQSLLAKRALHAIYTFAVRAMISL